MYRAILASIFSALMVSSCCAPIPWSAWKYEQVTKFEGYPSPWNLPSPSKHPDLYIDGAFVHVFLRAHDETTNSGSSPFMLIANVTTKNSEHESVIFHSISVSDSTNRKYLVQPISVNKAAKKTGDLIFPVTKKLEAFNYLKPSPEIKKYTHTSIWTDDSLELKPDLGHKVTVTIELEIQRKMSAQRKIIVYEFIPYEEGGVWQCISA